MFPLDPSHVAGFHWNQCNFRPSSVWIESPVINSYRVVSVVWKYLQGSKYVFFPDCVRIFLGDVSFLLSWCACCCWVLHSCRVWFWWFGPVGCDPPCFYPSRPVSLAGGSSCHLSPFHRHPLMCEQLMTFTFPFCLFFIKEGGSIKSRDSGGGCQARTATACPRRQEDAL